MKPRTQKLYATADGRSHTLKAWAEIVGVTYTAFHLRFKKWGIEEAVRMDFGANHRYRYIEFDGETKTLTDWAKSFGLQHNALSEQIIRFGEQEAMRMAYEARPSKPLGGIGVIDHFLQKYQAVA